MHFLVGNNGATEAMTILNSGNVGIGTTSPGYKMVVQTGVQWDGMVILNGAGNLNLKYGTDGTTTGNGYFRLYDNAGNSPVFFRASSGVNYINSGNVGIGTTSPGGGTTAGTAVLSIANGTAPVGGVANQASLYAADVTASSELFALDEAGNATQLSPHDPVTGEWIFFSKNTRTGRVVRVDMERIVKAIEMVTGERFMIETFEQPHS
jgi:hypothetical protein